MGASPLPISILFGSSSRQQKLKLPIRADVRYIGAVITIPRYVEACESGSMFANTLSAAALPGVYAVTAASPSQPSYPIYCCVFERPPSCTVHGQDIGSCLGDQFSVGWLEAADLNSKAETLEQSFLKGKKRARAIGGTLHGELFLTVFSLVGQP